jgi:hypothetical protein
MSKELLKRVRDTLHELEETHYDLYWDIQAELDKPDQEPIPVYTAPPKSEPLSKEEYMSLFIDTYHSINPITDFVRLIEKAHGIGVVE